MRKYFLSLVAMAAMILFSGCNKNEDFYISENGDMVTFNIATPEMGTRAFSDGTTATNLIVAVYQGGQYREALTQNVTINGSAQVSLPLVTGVTYDIVFWAYAEGAPYTFTPSTGIVSVNYDNVTANNENLDAFYANRLGYEVKGPKTETVELTRPFAQLNVATLDYDLAAKSGIEITSTAITVDGVYTSLDLRSNGAIIADKNTDPITLTLNQTPSVAGQKLQGYTEYTWLSMNYLLVNEKTTISATMTTNNDNVTREWHNIPVQRNYRTNILGNILTTTTDFNVVIDERFAGDVNPAEWDGTSIIEPKEVNGVYHIDGAAQLAWLAAAVNGTLPTKSGYEPAQSFKGKTFELGMDINLNDHSWTPIGNNGGKKFEGTFDGKGFTISNITVAPKDDNDIAPKGLFGSASYVKNLTVKDVEISGHYKTGAIVGDGLCSRIDNCHVDGGSVISTPDANKNNGNHAGGIVGYLSAESEAYVKNSSVKNLTITAYRDVAGIAGTANGSSSNKPVVSNCLVEKTTITADQSCEYIEENKAGNAGEIVGRNNKNIDLSSNRAVDVTVVGTIARVTTNEELEKALMDATQEHIVINLDKNYTLKGKTSSYGSEKSKTITINGNGKTLTFEDSYRTYIKNEGGKFIFNNVNIIRNTSNTNTHYHNNNMSFNGDVEMNNVTFNKGILIGNTTAKLNQVTINKDNVNTYAIFVTIGANVTLDGCTIDAENVGRGIKIINEDNTNSTENTSLVVKNTTFKTKEKAAILVFSHTQTSITLENIDITGVEADKINAVWVDEDAAEYYDLVTVTGGTKFQEGAVLVTTLDGLKEELQKAGAAGAGNTTIVISADIDMTGKEWTPIKVDGYNGADVVTVYGNNCTITGLTKALFAGGFAGGSGIVIKDLTIDNSQIIADNTQGYGAFICNADSMDEITLINCHLTNSSIITPNEGNNESRIGGLVGWTSGYDNQNDGPVDSYVTIQNCSVINCTLKGAGSIGGICGHAGANSATFTIIKNCTVKNCTLASTDPDSWRVGVVVGTANVGELTINNITESGNTLTQTGKTAPAGQSNLYGRFVPGATGKLFIDGEEIK